MRRTAQILFASLIAALCAADLGAQASAPEPQGRWDAILTLGQVEIPFRLDVSGSGAQLVGTLYNGDLPQTTTSASFDGGTLTLNFDQYPVRIVAHLAGGLLSGTIDGRFGTEHSAGGVALTATRHVDALETNDASTPSINGTWEIEHESPKGEKAWRFVVRQQGASVTASILRIDGDTGALVGRYRNGRFVLSHFDGTRPILAEVTLQQDGSLRITLRGAHVPEEPLIAWRPEAARDRQLPAPDDFFAHTTTRDANEHFSFSFPDVNGKIVSSDDPQFKGKAYLVTVTGTWCPNCHDETQYLVQLYAKYHSRGLEIVALDFEEPDQQTDLRRARAFIRKYNVPYPYLIAGAPSELHDKVPQAVNLNTWPATFFIGKDGRVRKIHSGFAAPASGTFNAQLQAEFASEIESLLADGPNPIQAVASSPANGIH
jgi:peroxiredoxin